MATLNLGRIKPVFQGAYSGSTAYVVDDIVTFGNETFICIQASTGNATSNASYWTKLAAKGADGSDGTDVGTTLTTQGDILYRDGSGLQRLAAGTSGQVLQTGGAGANPSWTAVSGGAFGQMVFNTDTTSYSNSHQSNYVRATNSNVVITPSSASKSILVMFNLSIRSTHTDMGFQHKLIRIVGGSETVLRTSSSVFDYEHYAGTSGQNRYWHSTQFFTDAPNTTSAVTYVFEFRNIHRSDTIYVNDSDQSQIMALEIN